MNHQNRLAPEPCIYCASTDLRTKREHVMSRALGTFEQNWMLDCVCDSCNHFFSREFELALGRDSAEGFLRVDLGIKPPTAANKFLNRRMKGTLKAPGLFEGVRVVMEPTEAEDRIVPVPPPQVGFRRPGESWRYIPEKELSEELVREMAGCEIRVIGRGDDLSRLSRRLTELGCNYVETARLLDQPLADDGPIFVEFEFNVDSTLQRAAAKIAFNYAATVLSPEVVRRPDFDAVRRFIRLGEEPEALVTAERTSILMGSEAETTKTHACGLGWVEQRRELIAVVSFFNQITYRIRMCGSESNEWASVSSRHLFDPIKHTITDLLSAE